MIIQVCNLQGVEVDGDIEYVNERDVVCMWKEGNDDRCVSLNIDFKNRNHFNVNVTHEEYVRLVRVVELMNEKIMMAKGEQK